MDIDEEIEIPELLIISVYEYVENIYLNRKDNEINEPIYLSNELYEKLIDEIKNLRIKVTYNKINPIDDMNIYNKGNFYLPGTTTLVIPYFI